MALKQQTKTAETLPAQTAPAVGKGVPAKKAERPLTRDERVKAEEIARVAEEKRVIAEALEEFKTWGDAECEVALTRAKEDHDLNIAWSRSLDGKVAPLLTVAGLLVAAIYTLLGRPEISGKQPLSSLVLALSLVPLVLAVMKAVAVVSPTLRIRASLREFFAPQHTTPGDTESNMFYGAIARHKSLAGFVAQSLPALKDDPERMRDLLQQTYINGNICQQKNDELAFSARWILVALLMLLVWGAMFAYENNVGKLLLG